MLLARQQLSGTLAHPLRMLTAWKPRMIQEKPRQGPVVRPQLPVQEEVVPRATVEIFPHRNFRKKQKWRPGRSEVRDGCEKAANRLIRLVHECGEIREKCNPEMNHPDFFGRFFAEMVFYLQEARLPIVFRIGST